MSLVASGVDIKNKNGNLTAPTPQNTPINPAPITSSYRPSIPAISEDMETITTQGNCSVKFFSQGRLLKRDH